MATPNKKNVPPPLVTPEIVSSYNAVPPEGRRLILLDYDGTLSHLSLDPEKSVPAPRLCRVLSRLAADPRNQVWIVSGRGGDFLERVLADIEGLGLSSEHGAFVRYPRSAEWICERATAVGEGGEMRQPVLELLERYTKVLSGMSGIEKKPGSLCFHYRRAQYTQPELVTKTIPALHAELDALLAPHPSVATKFGSCVVEARAPGANKGVIARNLAVKYDHPPFVLTIGDEPTDEDMYAVMNALVAEGKLQRGGTWTVFVEGTEDQETCAQWSVGSVEAVWAVLEALAGIEDEEGA